MKRMLSKEKAIRALSCHLARPMQVSRHDFSSRVYNTGGVVPGEPASGSQRTTPAQYELPATFPRKKKPKQKSDKDNFLEARKEFKSQREKILEMCIKRFDEKFTFAEEAQDRKLLREMLFSKD